MPANAKGDDIPERPEFAVALGLLPPYTLDDVKRAYLDKVKDAHPDRGGTREAFDRIQHAYEQANEYLQFRSDRRHWIAARMDEYVAVAALGEKLRSLGAEVETITLDWVRRSFGDFANLTETITGIRLEKSLNVGELVETIVDEQLSLPGLKRLLLPGCPITDAMAIELRVLRSLTHLDLSHTSISDKALALAEWLPELQELNVDGTSIGWWARHQLHRTLSKRRKSRPDPVFHPVNIR